MKVQLDDKNRKRAQRRKILMKFKFKDWAKNNLGPISLDEVEWPMEVRRQKNIADRKYYESTIQEW